MVLQGTIFLTKLPPALFGLLILAPRGFAATASSISQYGITWTFDKPYEVGQFVTGDWWVVGPVTILNKTPAATGSGETYRHGSMINPNPGNPDEGHDGSAYDGRMPAPFFNSSKIISFPRLLAVGEKLISTESLETFPYTDVTGFSISSNQTYTKTAAILTCVASPPPDQSFRPPYAGSSMTLHTMTGFHWSALPMLTPPASAPAIATVATIFRRPWIDHMTNWLGRAMHPADNMPNYGRELASWVGVGGCLLTCNYSQSQKQDLAIGLTQLGIDEAENFKLNPEIFVTIAGQNTGRKFPVVFAGLMLGDAEMLNHPAPLAAEDSATYYGTDVTPPQTLWTSWHNNGQGVWGFPVPPVSANVLYLYIWGLDNKSDSWAHEGFSPQVWHLSPFPNNGNQYPWGKHEGYRRLATSSMVGQAIAARLLGLRTAWGHQAFFDYIDRWMYEDGEANRNAMAASAVAHSWDTLEPNTGLSWTNPDAWAIFPEGQAITPFERDMYLTYRPTEIPESTEPPPPDNTVESAPPHAWPVPWNPILTPTGIWLKGFQARSSVQVLAVNGAFARELTVDSEGKVLWDGRNAQGQEASSGAYLVLSIQNPKLPPLKIVIKR